MPVYEFGPFTLDPAERRLTRDGRRVSVPTKAWQILLMLVEAGGRLVRHSAPYRYVWPSELDLMAKIAGFRLRDRWAGWDRAPFTSGSPSQVAVFEKTA